MRSIGYTVSFAAAAAHYADVRLEFDEPPRDPLLWMPAWTPGSYLIRDFARNLRAVRARDAGGRELAVERVDKASLRILGRPAEIRYRVFAHERSVRTSLVDESAALLLGASLFLAVAGRENERHRVALETRPGWSVACALPRQDGRLVADDYGHLLDSPILCGAFEERLFAAGGRPHRLVATGRPALDLDRLAGDLRRIVTATIELFGAAPYPGYLFLLQASAHGRGGLEHRDSSVVHCDRFLVAEERGYHDLLTLLAHEHFHAWNVKRVAPRELVAPDLRAEVYSDQLWVAEGITAYYDELLPLRAGTVSRKAFLERLGESITRHRRSPGRRVQSLAEASRLAWIGLYRPDSDSLNSTVSYYEKGALVALLLDLEIRRRSAAARSLDTVMRWLFERHAEEGFSVPQFESLAAEAAGADLADCFAPWVRGTAELPFERLLGDFGLRLAAGPRAPRPDAEDFLGVRLQEGVRGVVIGAVAADSAAAAAGLSAGDEIVALDGHRVTRETFVQRLASRRLGSAVRLALFRDELLDVLEARLPERLPDVFRVEETDGAPCQAREAWLHARGEA